MLDDEADRPAPAAANLAALKAIVIRVEQIAEEMNILATQARAVLVRAELAAYEEE